MKAEENADGAHLPRHVQQSALAGCLPWKMWVDTSYLTLVWHVKWGSAGLVGTKPVVLFAKDFVMSAKSVQQITA